jgi:hypothetical protein
MFYNINTCSLQNDHGSKENYIKQRQLSMRQASIGLTVGEASASGSSDVGLESSAAAPKTESEALVLALATGSSGVA